MEEDSILLKQDDGAQQHRAPAGAGFPHGRHLVAQDGFGSNPGNLAMFKYVPDGLPAQAPLVVILHGCGQKATGYDVGTGWSELADRWGFALLLPEQQPANNRGGCFNWFEPGDVERDRGEVGSIRQMVERMRIDHDIDPAHIFVTGLSAGGAMAVALLATYPEVFAGGGIIAGLPYKSASGMPDAFMTMLRGKTRPPAEWGDLVRGATDHQGPWPRISIWQGDADRTVSPVNAVELAKQWANVHGISGPAVEDRINGHRRTTLHNADGATVVELYTIAGMSHGAPIDPGDAEDQIGTEGPFLLSVGIASTWHIARFWGLGPETAAPETAIPAAEEAVETAEPVEIETVSPAEPVPAFSYHPLAKPDKPGLVKRLWRALKGIVSSR